jgi:hypothetical protein
MPERNIQKAFDKEETEVISSLNSAWYIPIVLDSLTYPVHISNGIHF